MRPLRYFSHPLATLSPRDLLLLEHLDISPSAAALEVGTGSGSSLVRLAPWFARLDGVDVCQGPLERIRRAIGAWRPELAAKVRLFELDFCAPEAHARLPQKYDLIFSCDTIEHVPNPGAFLRNVHAVLKPGGRAFLTFPNEHPRYAHGISFFERKETLERLLLEAGFERGQLEITRLMMARPAEFLGWLAWFGPRKAMKHLGRLYRGNRKQPQTFDETDFFAAAGRFERLAPLINAYCWAVMRFMGMARPVYRIEPAGDVIWDMQILMRATKAMATVPADSGTSDRRRNVELQPVS
ncbi:MAG: methyltransferase [Pirellulales bacterium]